MRVFVAFFALIFFISNILGLFYILEYVLDNLRVAFLEALLFSLFASAMVFLMFFSFKLFSRWFYLGFVCKLFFAVYFALLLMCFLLFKVQALVLFFLLVLFSLLFAMISGLGGNAVYGKVLSEFIADLRQLLPNSSVFVAMLLFPVFAFVVIRGGVLLNEQYEKSKKEAYYNRSEVLSLPGPSVNSELSSEEKNRNANILSLIELFRAKDIQGLSQRVKYPLGRRVPLKNIKNEEDFLEVFYSVFDDHILGLILDSDVGDWHQLGSKGVLFDNGSVWLSLDGSEITGVSYVSDSEERRILKIIEEDKKRIHDSVASYEYPILNIKTKGFSVRVDYVNDSYRYSAWKLPKGQSEKPDLIINGGDAKTHGSGGNVEYLFVNGEYVYSVFRQYIGLTNADAWLTVERGGESVLSQEGELVEY